MVQTPDTVYAENTSARMAAIEARMGLDPLHVLLAQRQGLVTQAADLRARYGSFGTWDAIRKSQLSTIKMHLRATALREAVKKTEACLEEEAHADQRYIELIAQATKDRASFQCWKRELRR